jgi:hypothetical protein
MYGRNDFYIGVLYKSMPLWSRNSSRTKSELKSYMNQAPKIEMLIRNIEDFYGNNNKIINNWLININKYKKEFKENPNDGYDTFINNVCLLNFTDIDSQYRNEKISYMEYLHDFINKMHTKTDYIPVYKHYFKCVKGTGGKSRKRGANKKKKHTRRRKI